MFRAETTTPNCFFDKVNADCGRWPIDSDVNKDLTFKDKDQTIKAKDQDKKGPDLQGQGPDTQGQGPDLQGQGPGQGLGQL